MMNIKTDYIDVTIDLRAVRENYKQIREIVGQGTIVSSVIKSDAYGLGLSNVAKALFEAGCRDFWVADIQEGVEFRKTVSRDASIYVLYGYCDRANLPIFREMRLTPVINDIRELERIDPDIPCVIHIDTGLTRLGIRPEHFNRTLGLVASRDVIAVMSHLACSDNRGSPYNAYQKSIFDQFWERVSSIKDIGTCLAATGGVALGPGFRYEMVRVGAYLYGIDAGHLPRPKNIVSVRAKVIQLYEVQEGTRVGYDSTYMTRKVEKFAVLPIGYSHGIFRTLSNSGKVVFEKEGKVYYAPIVGKVSMDLMVCDVSDVPGILKGDEAYILGEHYTINEMARDAGTIPYEILTNLNLHSKKVKVRYYR